MGKRGRFSAFVTAEDGSMLRRIGQRRPQLKSNPHEGLPGFRVRQARAARIEREMVEAENRDIQLTLGMVVR